MTTKESHPRRFRRLLLRALRLRCPICGEGRLFRDFVSMHAECPTCQIPFEREPGFFLGAIYFNYGITAVLVLFCYGLLRIGLGVPSKQVLAATVGLAIVFPIWFHRYARSLWMGFDQFYDPRPSPLEPVDPTHVT